MGLDLRIGIALLSGVAIGVGVGSLVGSRVGAGDDACAHVAGTTNDPGRPLAEDAARRPVQRVTAAPEALPEPCAQPSASEIRERAALLGCDCPIAHPPGVDDALLPPAVEEWLEQVEAACPTLAQRDHMLDCSEWPCLLAVAMEDRAEGVRRDLAEHLTCGLQGPGMVFVGTVGAPPHFYHAFAIREPAQSEYARREMVRLQDISVPVTYDEEAR